MKGLVAAVLVLFGCAIGCEAALSEGGEWQPWDSIEGSLRPEVNLDQYIGEVANETIRLVTFNVEFGDDMASIAGAFETNVDLARADVILIQEIESYADEGLSRAEFLAQRLEMNHVYAPSGREGNGTQGLAILSRFPLQDVQVMKLPKADLYISARQRLALGATLVIGHQSLRVVDVHLDVRLNISQRVRQLHPVTLSADARTAIAGDFNTNPFSWAGSIPIAPDQSVSASDQARQLDDYMRAFGFDTPTENSGSTQDSSIGEFRLDSIYSRELSTSSVGVVDGLALSDHAPLWADIRWP